MKKDLKAKLKEYFFNHPSARLRVRQIERELAMPLPSVIRYCNELVKEEILYIFELATVKVFAANTSSERYRFEKQLYNLRKIFDSGLINFFKDELFKPTIVLFGSFQKGDNTEESDIDIYIEHETEEELNLEPFEKKLNLPIELFWFKSFKEIPNPHLSNNIANGTTLLGSLTVYEDEKTT